MVIRGHSRAVSNPQQQLGFSGGAIPLAGGEPVILGNAKDSLEDLRVKIGCGLEADALILSGGVSMGKYDLVEPVLREFGAEFIFDAVAIRPGKPVVLRKVQDTRSVSLDFRAIRCRPWLRSICSCSPRIRHPCWCGASTAPLVEATSLRRWRKIPD